MVVSEYRSGIGYDVHPLTTGRKLILGGVCLPYEKGLKGHSDADVLVHAIMDAILGAAGEGDIGEHFPDTSSEYKDASSIRLLKYVGQLVAQKGFTIVNVDAVLLAEEPKIKPYKNEMGVNIAGALGIDLGRVNIKATTNEGLGFVGAKEGMAAYATASLCKG
ncbi:MAG: 2-C-methyl-D-erythritol 2,4-cyclodiphosphate synthase [Candidatus Omnitrophica bacterium]|nr:2-C-methyl-D-erythritol 2,4-cyclodiphosphate synthase [Candidatus Omnitrophota bacterium]